MLAWMLLAVAPQTALADGPSDDQIPQSRRNLICFLQDLRHKAAAVPFGQGPQIQPSVKKLALPPMGPPLEQDGIGTT